MNLANVSVTSSTSLCRLRRYSLWIALVGLIGMIIGATIDLQHVMRSYLFAYAFWLGLPLGSLVFTMVHGLVGGDWGIFLQKSLDGSLQTMGLLAVLFLPLAMGLPYLYPWAESPAESGLFALSLKAIYLTPAPFLARSTMYLGSWVLITRKLLRRRSEPAFSPIRAKNHRAFCAVALILHMVIGTFASIDWLRSIEPAYYSTIYGLLVLSGQCVLALSFAVAVSAYLRSKGLRRQLDFRKDAHRVYCDVGSLLATNILFWAYLQFGQLIVNWSGNTVREIPWYLHRSNHGWGWIAVALIVFHFALPFSLLIFRAIKASLPRLYRVAVLVMAVHVLADCWLIIPSYQSSPFGIHWLDGSAMLMLGGLWMTTFLSNLRADISLGAA